ncbi:MAG: XRE family transcriptional regulator [Streptosporangiaceae bacterium]
MNETLRRALMWARLSEEDVAALLEVDPKTVRRWLEGRLPYLRHRWALAGLVGLDEVDLWPQLRTTRSRPDEVRAIYPHRDGIPREAWQDFFRSAEHEIGILAVSGQFLAQAPTILAILHNRAAAGVRLRICLRNPGSSEDGDTVARIREDLALYYQLHDSCDVQIRLHEATLNNSIYRADDELLVVQHAYGVPTSRTPVLHLRRTANGDMVTTYLESFHRIWANALPWR